MYFLNRFSKYPQISNFMKIHPVGAELFQAVRQTDNMTKLIVAFRNFANAPKNWRHSLSVILGKCLSWLDLFILPSWHFVSLYFSNEETEKVFPVFASFNKHQRLAWEEELPINPKDWTNIQEL
jgi:hypothetical protein